MKEETRTWLFRMGRSYVGGREMKSRWRERALCLERSSFKGGGRGKKDLVSMKVKVWILSRER